MMDQITERKEFDEVELVWKRGHLTLVFRGKLVYDTSFKDDDCTGWQFDGVYFSVTMFNDVVVETTIQEKDYLCWSYRLSKHETSDTFFMNLLNGLTTK
jgi:hypothetical protein